MKFDFIKRTFPRLEDSDFKRDIDRIIYVCSRMGAEITPEEAVYMYESYSEDNFAAGWMTLPQSDIDLYLIMKEEIIRFLQDRLTIN